MTAAGRRRRTPGRSSRRRRIAAALVVLLFGAVMFVLGAGLGQALGDEETPRGATTYVRTLKPLPLPPARETVTVTVTRP